MTKPDISLQGSKRAVSEMAVHIYAAYISRGVVRRGQEKEWMDRSIRQAVRIARVVDSSIRSADHGGGKAPSSHVSGSSTNASAGSGAPHSAGEALQEADFDDVILETLAEESKAAV